MMEIIDPFFGAAEIRALQKAQDQQVEALRDTPGAVIHARAFSSDDPDRLGWDRLRHRMATDGKVTLRGVSETEVERAQQELSGFSPSLHRWDIFMADAAALELACRPLVQTPLPPGLHQVASPDIDASLLHDVQSFLSDQGISPFSKDALAGRLFPAQLVVLRDDDKQIAAAGFAAMTHNRFSPYHGVAWVGLIAVAPRFRGQALGKRMDAICNLVALDQLGATATMEFVAQDNIPSRRMLESCGLRQRVDRSVVMFSTSTERLTR